MPSTIVAKWMVLRSLERTLSSSSPQRENSIPSRIWAFLRNSRSLPRVQAFAWGREWPPQYTRLNGFDEGAMGTLSADNRFAFATEPADAADLRDQAVSFNGLLPQGVLGAVDNLIETTRTCPTNFKEKQRNVVRRSILDRWIRRMTAQIIRASLKARRRGDWDRALTLLRFLVRLVPNSPRLHLLLGEAASRCSELTVLTNAIEFAHLHMSETPRVMGRLARLCSASGDAERAKLLVETAMGLFPDSSFLYGIRGEMHLDRSEFERATECFERQRELAPSDSSVAMATCRLACSYEDQGRKANATDLYRHLIRQGRCVGVACSRLVDCEQQLDCGDDLTGWMEGTLRSASPDRLDEMHLRYALGQLYDRGGQPKEAFSHFEAANEIRGRNLRWSSVAQRRAAARRIKFFTADRIDALARYGSDDESGIIVVGMPRSGTTLIEQILSAHSTVRGLGERIDIWCLGQRLHTSLRTRNRYPECLPLLSGSVVRNLSRELARARRNDMAGCTRYVTKRPEDFWELGLIAILFPKTRIIHANRHPIDTCLSCYMQDFDHILYSTKLKCLADTYRVYRSLMAHWRTVLSAPPMLNVNYEDLVGNPERSVRRLCDFCGLTYEDACMRFHEKRTFVNTASKWQVRRPIYQSSVNRWDRYREFLGPLLGLESLASSEVVPTSRKVRRAAP
jgi:tetratricopeptide (TPR) repeat protein